MDGANAHAIEAFKLQFNETNCCEKQMDPHTTLTNSKEGTITEMKKSLGWKIMESKFPKRLQGDCITP